MLILFSDAEAPCALYLLETVIKETNEGQRRYAEEDARHAANFAAGEHAENDHQRMKLHAFAHEERGKHVILKQTVDAEENHQPQHVGVTVDYADADDDDGRGERSDQRNELERKRNRGQQ